MYKKVDNYLNKSYNMNQQNLNRKTNEQLNYKPVRGWKLNSEEAMVHKRSINDQENESMYFETEFEPSRANSEEFEFKKRCSSKLSRNDSLLHEIPENTNE